MAADAEKDIPGAALSRADLLKVMGAAVAAGAVAATVETPEVEAALPQGGPAPTTSSAPFKFRLDAQPALRYAAGTLRTMSKAVFPVLDDMALYSERVNAGGLRELHWHPNAHELSYVIQGRAVFGVFMPQGTYETAVAGPGSVTFIPAGYFHYIRNVGTDTLWLSLCFTSPSPQNLNLSATMPWVPRSLLAETFGVATDAFPNTPPGPDRRIVPISSRGATGPGARQPFSVPLDSVKAHVYEGGSINILTPTQIPSLTGVTIYDVFAKPYALREPHWHPNSAELSFIIEGQAQFGIVTPFGKNFTFTAGPGDSVFIPRNYFHYIYNPANSNLHILVYFSNADANHIDISEAFGALPKDVIGASFNMGPDAFAHLPNRGDVLLAGRHIGRV